MSYAVKDPSNAHVSLHHLYAKFRRKTLDQKMEIREDIFNLRITFIRLLSDERLSQERNAFSRLFRNRNLLELNVNGWS